MSRPKPPDPNEAPVHARSGARRSAGDHGRGHLRLVGSGGSARAQSSPDLDVELQNAAVGSLGDAQLVALACKGDRAAFEVLYRRHARFALNLATRIEGSDRDVEDIVHDAFLKAFERIGDLTDRGAFRGWLGSIVVHAVRSRLRRHRLMRLLGIAPPADHVDLDVLASPDASPHARAQLAQVYALLRTLPTDERIAWTLRAVEGHDLETVAKLTRCSLATVKRRIKRTQDFLEHHFVHPDRDGREPTTESDDLGEAPFLAEKQS